MYLVEMILIKLVVTSAHHFGTITIPFVLVIIMLPAQVGYRKP